jgi:hypothetical protein
LTSWVVPVAGAAVAVPVMPAAPAPAAESVGVAEATGVVVSPTVEVSEPLLSPPPQAPRTSALAANTKALKRM